MRKEQLIHYFTSIRQKTETLCRPLAIEDYVIQSIEDVSPPKWHLAHTSWFFEAFIFNQYITDYKPFNNNYQSLFNSYYQSLGNPYPRAKRGLLSRPTVEEIYAYRCYIDTRMLTLLEQITEPQLAQLATMLIWGLQHEQQHQELLLMDIKHNFSLNPSFPVYQRQSSQNTPNKKTDAHFITIEGGLVDIGHHEETFCFDNELPRHKKYLLPYSIANQLITNQEYLEFIDAGGYQQPAWWLADGWDCIVKNNWQAPLYWHRDEDTWHIFSLHGLEPLNLIEPVSHISYYEADAYARWRGARLPLEEEWEYFIACQKLVPEQHHFMEAGLFHPQPAKNQQQPQQFFGDLWEWTASPYQPYPGYKPLKGALGEYNGKFMSNQMVLKGGCCITPQSHIRASYRNFFQPEKRWQFSGIRLAKS